MEEQRKKLEDSKKEREELELEALRGVLREKIAQYVINNHKIELEKIKSKSKYET